MSPGSLIATSQLLCVTSDTFCATSQQAHFITRCELHSPEMQEAILDWSEILFLFFFPPSFRGGEQRGEKTGRNALADIYIEMTFRIVGKWYSPFKSIR